MEKIKYGTFVHGLNKKKNAPKARKIFWVLFDYFSEEIFIIAPTFFSFYKIARENFPLTQWREIFLGFHLIPLFPHFGTFTTKIVSLTLCQHFPEFILDILGFLNIT